LGPFGFSGSSQDILIVVDVTSWTVTFRGCDGTVDKLKGIILKKNLRYQLRNQERIIITQFSTPSFDLFVR
jgi:hypothetical protein